jgi:CRISPR system Cascade subunit CasC
MSMLELHLIQNFAPSNLNRDDTGSPKDCEFGGFRRARISSQCQKKAMRNYFASASLLQPEELAVRTKRAAEIVKEHLVAAGKPAEEAGVAAMKAVLALGIPEGKKPGLTGYLLYLSKSELKNLCEWALANYDKLLSAEKKNKGKAAEPKAKLDGKKAADLALFGRMLADIQEQSVDAAAQVAHAISTHRVSVEFDYYTAVDDRQPADNAGADMVGTIEFNSACYYRYANVNLNILRENLGDDPDLLARTVKAFVRAFALSIPTGKQNSMAAHNPPSFILAVRRSSGPCNLSNAFVKPVRASDATSLIEASVQALDRYWHKLLATFGSDGIEDSAVWTLDEHKDLKLTGIEKRFDDFVTRACGASGEKAA